MPNEPTAASVRAAEAICDRGHYCRELTFTSDASEVASIISAEYAELVRLGEALMDLKEKRDAAGFRADALEMELSKTWQAFSTELRRVKGSAE